MNAAEHQRAVYACEVEGMVPINPASVEAMAAEIRAFNEREAVMRPVIEKVCAQYTRGLITAEELAHELRIITLTTP